MDVTFDPAKDMANRDKHGLSLADFTGFEGEVRYAIDDRFSYGEQRIQARGWIDGRGYCLVFTPTATGVRLISFRRAHDKEMRRHG